MFTDITKWPVLDLRDEAKLSTIFPNDFIKGLPICANDALSRIMDKLAPDEDPAPMAMVLGWDPAAPTVDIVAIDGRYLRDGQTKHDLAQGLRDMILKRRAMDQETYAFALVYGGWMHVAPRPKNAEGMQALTERIEDYGRNGLGNEPDKIEVITCNTIWQDGQRLLVNQVRRREGKSPMLGSWHDMSAGSVIVKDRFWHAIAPALAATAYADAVLAAFEGEEEK